MIIPCPLEQSIDESTFFKPWKSLPLLFASNSGLVNSRSYNVWKSSTVFHCHLFFTGIQVFKLFVRGDKQNPIGFKGERTLRGKMIQKGQIVGNRSWQKLPDLRLKWEQIPWSSCPVFVAMEAFTFRKWSLVPLIDFGQMFVTCLVTWKPNKLIVLWSSVFWWFFMLSYAF